MKPKLELLNSKIAFKIKPTNPCIQNISHISQNNLSSEGDKKANDIETNESEDDYLNQLRIKSSLYLHSFTYLSLLKHIFNH